MSKSTMKRRIRWQTIQCVKCRRRRAKSWGGAVQFGREWVLAGWCGFCRHAHWFHGDYSPTMGREKTS